MKGSIIRVAISVLMLFVLYSCKGIAEEEQQSDPVPVGAGIGHCVIHRDRGWRCARARAGEGVALHYD